MMMPSSSSSSAPTPPHLHALPCRGSYVTSRGARGVFESFIELERNVRDSYDDITSMTVEGMRQVRHPEA